MLDYPKLFAFFDEYIEHYKTFLQFEYLKLEMINNDDIEKLSSSLSREQALIMKTNSLEKKRIDILGDEAGKTFQELIDSAPKWYQYRLTDKYNQLSEVVLKIKEINDTANVIVSERLNKIQKKVGELDTYDEKGTVSKEKISHSALLKSI
jgi:hypothetical protein